VSLHICRTPMKEILREPDRVRWCFRCRAHLPHDFVVLATVEPSYYDPTPRYDCSRCGEDHTLGFGMEREWSE
jgi:hypothetical protein